MLPTLTTKEHLCKTFESIEFQVGLWIDAGSRFETEKNNGVAHFLEHMAFKVLSTSYLLSVDE